jgi:hypothetical protein
MEQNTDKKLGAVSTGLLYLFLMVTSGGYGLTIFSVISGRDKLLASWTILILVGNLVMMSILDTPITAANKTLADFKKFSRACLIVWGLYMVVQTILQSFV